MQDFSDDTRFGDDLFQDKPKGKNRGLFIPFILIGGMITTVATLIGIFFLSLYFETNILSFVVNFIFPVGAIFAGLVAGSGYAITARLLQYKPTGSFIFFICLIQFAMFFVGRYLECVPVLLLAENPPGFVEMYRSQIEDSEWTSKNSKEPFTMGKWGWGLELLTALAFSLTSLVWIAVLSAVAYCAQCRIFMKKELEFVFPARIPVEKIKKKDSDALADFQKRDTEALDKAMGEVAKIVDFLDSDRAKDREETYRFLGELRDEVASDPKALNKVPNKIKISFSRCRKCDNYQLIALMEVHDINNKTALSNGELFRYADGRFLTRQPDAPAADAAQGVPAQDER